VSLPTPGVPPVLEWDELWSFVRSKAEPAWVWVALDRATRQVVACCWGDRSQESCRFLWEQVPAPWREATCYTDLWEAYRAVLPDAQQAAGPGTGETAHVERWNNSLRQRLGAFVRKTLSFSKCDQMHWCRLKLFLHRYNLSRVTLS
jgi:insertion element IS1 protein InsB